MASVLSRIRAYRRLFLRQPTAARHVDKNSIQLVAWGYSQQGAGIVEALLASTTEETSGRSRHAVIRRASRARECGVNTALRPVAIRTHEPASHFRGCTHRFLHTVTQLQLIQQTDAIGHTAAQGSAQWRQGRVSTDPRGKIGRRERTRRRRPTGAPSSSRWQPRRVMHTVIGQRRRDRRGTFAMEFNRWCCLSFAELLRIGI